MGKETESVVANLKIGGRTLQPNEYLAAADETTSKNLKSILDRLGVALVSALEKNSPVASGKLASSWRVIGVKDTKDGTRLEVGTDIEYADYIDKGVKGIKNRKKQIKNKDGKYYQFKTYGMPPEALKSLEGWAKIKNIDLKGQKAVDKSEGRPNYNKLIKSPSQRLAYYIKKYGIAGRNFKQKSLDEVLPDYEVQIKEVSFNSLVLKIKT